MKDLSLIQTTITIFLTIIIVIVMKTMIMNTVISLNQKKILALEFSIVPELILN